MISREYMGRMFMLPPEHEKDGQELWINFGWNTADNRLFPSYHDVLAPICSQQQFDDLMRSVKDYAAEHSLNQCMAQSSLIMCMACCLPVPLVCVYWQVRQFNSGLEELLNAASQKTFPVRVRYKLTQAIKPATAAPPPCDQFGRALQFTVSDEYSSTTQVGWPPLGYNIIIDVPKDFNLRAHWPTPVAFGGTAASAVLNGSAGAPPPYSAAPSSTPAERLKTLEELRSSSLIAESEYQSRRSAILAEL
jgi:hypothetical protein